jgi:serine palmitoyltransferase
LRPAWILRNLRCVLRSSFFPTFFVNPLSLSSDVHLELERDIAAFLKVPAAIIYAHAFSCVSSVIPSFCKRGDIIVADRSVNFAITKGIQISRSNVKYYDHGDYEGLERILEGIRKEDKKYKRNPTASRRFIITEGIFENDGSMVDLPKVVRLHFSLLIRPWIQR